MLILWRSLVLIAFTSLAVLLIPAQVMEDRPHTTFLFHGFNGRNLILQGDASVIDSESVLALTNHSQENCSHEFLLGRALYAIPVQMKSNESTLSSFSTTFVFSIVPPLSNAGGCGIAFFMTPHTCSIPPPAELLHSVGVWQIWTAFELYLERSRRRAAARTLSS